MDLLSIKCQLFCYSWQPDEWVPVSQSTYTPLSLPMVLTLGTNTKQQMAQREQLFSIQKQCQIQNSIMHQWIQKPFMWKVLSVTSTSVPLLFVSTKPLQGFFLRESHFFKIISTGVLCSILISTQNGETIFKADSLRMCQHWSQHTSTLPLKIVCQKFFPILIYMLINLMNNIAVSVLNGLPKNFSKEKLLKEIKVQPKSPIQMTQVGV